MKEPNDSVPRIVIELVDGQRLRAETIMIRRKEENLVRTGLSTLRRIVQPTYERLPEYILICSSFEGPRSVGLSEVKGLSVGLGRE